MFVEHLSPFLSHKCLATEPQGGNLVTQNSAKKVLKFPGPSMRNQESRSCVFASNPFLCCVNCVNFLSILGVQKFCHDMHKMFHFH